MNRVLALDVGGTNLRLAIVDETGYVEHEVRKRIDLSVQQFPTTEAAETHIVKSLLESMRPLIASHSPECIGIGFPGFFRGSSGVLASSPNLPGLSEFRLAERLSVVLELPVSIQNDALCAAIGEHRFGAGSGHPHMIHLTLGTGVGAGLILHHQPWIGEGGMAMEFGHLVIDRSEEALPCGCGNRGCLETVASATGVRRRYSFLSGKHLLDTSEVYHLAGQGDDHAKQALQEAGSALGLGIAEAAKLLDVHLVTISGGLTGAWELISPALETSMNQAVIPPLRGRIKVRRSSLGDKAGLLGAASIAHAR